MLMIIEQTFMENMCLWHFRALSQYQRKPVRLLVFRHYSLSLTLSAVPALDKCLTKIR